MPIALDREKAAYIDNQLVHLLHFWVSFVTGAGSFAIMSLSFLDYFVTPENFKTFLSYRLIASGSIFLIYLINRKVVNRYAQPLFTIASGIIVSSMIALMIAKFGGHRSPYFAGIILAVIYIIAFTPLDVVMSLIAGFTMYLIYLVPILIYDQISDVAFFVNANVFILASTVSLIFMRHLIHLRYVREFSLQYDLEQQKKQLQAYSLQLKDMVDERTLELRKSEQWHRSLVDNATDGIIVLDRNGIIVNVNDRACEMHGFPKNVLLGTHIRLLENNARLEDSANRLQRLLAGEGMVFECVHNKKDGSPLYLEISSKAITIGDEVFIQSFYRDITEKKKLQEHVFQSQKMDSIGVLAGGIAHDFNNILTAIIGHSDMIRRSVLDEKALRSLNVIEEASRRAGRMISKLLGFARKSNFEVVPLNLNDAIFDTVKLLERVIDKRINLTVELDNRLPLVRGDANQMEQVIMNLIVNARDAMPNGGSITIKTTSREILKGMPDVPPYVPAGQYVIVNVSDTGVGIPSEIMDKIFEPFFTTKERGKGTGLGLSMVYGVIKEHKGFIAVQSFPGRGTTFTLYLPAAVAEARQEEHKQMPSVSGNETILVVDDEQDILQAIQDSLSSSGYKVFAFSDAATALSLFQKLSPEIVLVITDIVMPRLNGKELIARLKAINPDVKILAISGYTKYVAPKDEIGEINGFLQKPFESYYLLSTVRRILDAHSQPAMHN